MHSHKNRAFEQARLLLSERGLKNYKNVSYSKTLDFLMRT